MATNSLLNRPQYCRSMIARGVAEKEQAVERTGNGVIYGATVITRGEALGHRMWIDSDFLDEVVSAAASRKGVKARFTHPGLSSDGLGKYLGRLRNAYRDGDTVRGDLHFSATSHKTPDGDLASYVMDMADEHPDDFGMSIVFEPDYVAEEAFVANHKDKDGRFKSPDSDNKKNYEHARLSILRAADVVDEPAANPGGMFHATDIPQQAEDAISYALGLSSDPPASSLLGIDPDRLAGFVRRFLARHDLQITGVDMSTKQKPELEAVEDVKPEETVVIGDEVVVTGSDQEEQDDTTTEADAPQDALSSRDEVRRYLTAFGPQGAEWYADGLSFEEATTKYSQQLAEENERLKKLLAGTRGEEEPLSSGLEEEPADKKRQDLEHKIGENRARYAAAVKLKTSRN